MHTVINHALLALFPDYKLTRKPPVCAGHLNKVSLVCEYLHHHIVMYIALACLIIGVQLNHLHNQMATSAIEGNLAAFKFANT